MKVKNGVLTEVRDSDIKDGIFIVPEDVRAIGKNAFILGKSLRSINLPESVESIGQQAFYNCTNLQSIIMSKGVKTIGGYAFSGCKGLQSITLHEGVQEIGFNAFSRCTSLQSITLPEGVKKIEDSAFSECKSLESIILPESVETIGHRAFSECTSLHNINIPKRINMIDKHMFFNCTSLQSITLPEGVKEIGDKAFSECSSLQSITLPETVEKIGHTAFSECTNLHSIFIPQSVQSIGSSAFYNCTSLRLICIFATSLEEHQRVTNLLPESLRRIVFAHEFTQRFTNMVDRELGRIMKTATTNPMRRCAKNIPFFPDELFTEINKQTNPKDHPFCQKALREISKLILPNSEEAFAAYEKQVKQLVDNTIAKSKTVLVEDPRQTRLYDIVKKLIENIENTKNGRKTSGKGSTKIAKLNQLGREILKFPADKWLEKEDDFIDQIRTVCALRSNKMHFWKTPQSLEECNTLLVTNGFVGKATATPPTPE